MLITAFTLNLSFAKPTSLTLNTDKSPELLKLFVYDINHYFTPEQKKNIIPTLNLINEDAKYYDKFNLFSFINGEFYKFYLNDSQFINASKDKLSVSLINQFEKKYLENELVYTNMSKFIINSIRDDLKSLNKNNFVLHYQNKARKESKNYIQIKKLKLIEKYVVPWMNLTIIKSAENFNKMMSEKIFEFLTDITKRMKILKIIKAPEIDSLPLFLNIESLSPEKNDKNEDQTVQQNDNLQGIKDISEIKDDTATDVIDDLIIKIPQ